MWWQTGPSNPAVVFLAQQKWLISGQNNHVWSLPWAWHSSSGWTGLKMHSWPELCPPGNLVLFSCQTQLERTLQSRWWQKGWQVAGKEFVPTSTAPSDAHDQGLCCSWTASSQGCPGRWLGFERQVSCLVQIAAVAQVQRSSLCLSTAVWLQSLSRSIFC